jgi:predicted Zn-dependent protease
MRLIVGLIMIIFSLFSYCGSREYNAVTGSHQYIGLTARQEVALGVQSVPEMLKQFGGLQPDARLQDKVDRVGMAVVSRSRADDPRWQYEFHLLNDSKTINAFALPGGQIFITAGLYRLFTTSDQLAAVLAHEIAHVAARHSAQRIAKSKLTNGLLNAVIVGSGDATVAQITALAGQLVNMKFSREDEVEADRLGVFFMTDAGFDPNGMVELMEVLEKSGGGARMPEFFSTHPSPDNRIEKIRQAIAEYAPPLPE